MADREVEDNRKRVLVLIESGDARAEPEWLCPDCLFPVLELHNATVLGMSDVIDFDSRKNVLIGVHHSGFFHTKTGEKIKCKVRYYFTLGEHA